MRQNVKRRALNRARKTVLKSKLRKVQESLAHGSRGRSRQRLPRRPSRRWTAPRTSARFIGTPPPGARAGWPAAATLEEQGHGLSAGPAAWGRGRAADLTVAARRIAPGRPVQPVSHGLAG